MSNYIPLNIQLFATGGTDPWDTEFEVFMHEEELSNGAILVTFSGSQAFSGIYSENLGEDIMYTWDDIVYPTSTISVTFTSQYVDTWTFSGRYGSTYTMTFDVYPNTRPDDPEPTPSVSADGIISLNGIDFSDIQFNNNQVSAVYYNGICVWTLDEEEKAPDNAITYNGEYVTYNNKYITYKEEK